MGEIIEVPSFGMQETVERHRRRKLVDLLKEEMDGVDGRGKKWKMIKLRLVFSKMSCCGASWSFKATSNMDVREEDDDDQEEIERENPGFRGQFDPDPNLTPLPTPASGMNLASALAEERNFRAAQEWENGGYVPPNTAEPSPGRMSLIRLIEESNGRDEERENEKEVGNDSMCCVCMGRKKGAAFIPCGHTFCRVCSREIWLNRGGCPLCNQSILEILDIF